ncbi:MAG: hypothetical protein KI790_13945 [Cyclobacteriaceae bacterium]|nr:hypothetical protein [Cyclobacteriaceae bacterium HetDA_MAG_MS6]
MIRLFLLSLILPSTLHSQSHLRFWEDKSYDQTIVESFSTDDLKKWLFSTGHKQIKVKNGGLIIKCDEDKRHQFIISPYEISTETSFQFDLYLQNKGNVEFGPTLTKGPNNAERGTNIVKVDFNTNKSVYLVEQQARYVSRITGRWVYDDPKILRQGKVHKNSFTKISLIYNAENGSFTALIDDEIVTSQSIEGLDYFRLGTSYSLGFELTSGQTTIKRIDIKTENPPLFAGNEQTFYRLEQVKKYLLSGENKESKNEAKKSLDSLSNQGDKIARRWLEHITGTQKLEFDTRSYQNDLVKLEVYYLSKILKAYELSSEIPRKYFDKLLSNDKMRDITLSDKPFETVLPQIHREELLSYIPHFLRMKNWSALYIIYMTLFEKEGSATYFSKAVYCRKQLENFDLKEITMDLLDILAKSTWGRYYKPYGAFNGSITSFYPLDSMNLHISKYAQVLGINSELVPIAKEIEAKTELSRYGKIKIGFAWYFAGYINESFNALKRSCVSFDNPYALRMVVRESDIDALTKIALSFEKKYGSRHQSNALHAYKKILEIDPKNEIALDGWEYNMTYEEKKTRGYSIQVERGWSPGDREAYSNRYGTEWVPGREKVVRRTKPLEIKDVSLDKIVDTYLANTKTF